MKAILISFSLLLLFPLFSKKDINFLQPYNGVEKYDPSLARLNSVDKLENYTDSIAFVKKINLGSPQYFALLENVISNRFYHGFSHFSLSENWIAALTEKFSNIYVASKVKPEDILQHPSAGCSQQSIVMMAVAANKGVSYRRAGFIHHYALELQAGDNWYLFDPDMEPTITLAQRKHEAWSSNCNTLKPYYNPAVNDLDYAFGMNKPANIGLVNEKVASKVMLFQDVTGVISKLAFCFPLVFVFVKRKKKKTAAYSSSAMYAIRPAEYGKMINLYPTISA